MDRVILHCDCNSYYASVESVARPELKTVPMAVCGDPKNRHGIILAKNELAKGFGVQTAETIQQAMRKCPGLVLVPPHHEKYEEYCRRINAIYQQYTDRVEAFSIDESWLDVTGCLRRDMTGARLADLLRRRVREEIGVTISAGVSFNKTFAKMGSDYKKPDATTEITRENYQTVLWPLPVRELLFIGRVAAETLTRAGILTIGDIAAQRRESMAALLGRAGAAAWDRANGIDSDPVKKVGENDPAKSIGNSITFARDLRGEADVRAGLLMLSDQVGARLRQQGLYCATVQIQIKDPSLKVIQRQQKMEPATNATKDILDAAMALMKRSWNLSAPIRLLSVTAAGLTDHRVEQLSLLEEPREDHKKRERLDSAMDKIRQRYGKDTISFASTVKTDLLGKED